MGWWYNMTQINVNAEAIELYTKQLRMPTFNRYEDVLRQLSSDKSYEKFLLELLKMEVASRAENNQKRKIKACLQGLNVRFYTAANLSNELVEAQEYKKLIKLEKQLANVD